MFGVNVTEVTVAPGIAPETVTEVVKLVLSTPLAELDIGAVDKAGVAIPKVPVCPGHNSRSAPALTAGNGFMVTF